MRQSLAAIAIIRRQAGDKTLWLAQWNDRWQRFHFVGGHKHDDESFRQCVVREVGEELEIAEGTGCLVGECPLAHLDYTAWSAGAGEETHYVMELFDVQLFDDAVWQQVDADPQNRWLTAAEILGKRCRDGLLVSETMGLLLVRAGLCPGRPFAAESQQFP
jgi:8-oxo-dGTP pyrophosphatase MutT (NUDIX family)